MALKRATILLLLKGIFFSANAQRKIFDYLNPARYNLGLKIVQTYHYSQTFGPWATPNDQRSNNARPIQILVRYPGTGGGC